MLIVNVEESAKDRRTDASSVRTARSERSRQAGSGTKQAFVDGRSSTAPRGDVPDTSPAKAERTSGNARVFVLDRQGSPIMPCHPARARELLRKGRAVVVRLYPYTIRVKDRIGGNTQPVSLKFDPGSRVTGIAIARESSDGTHALWLGELEHRGAQIQKSIEQRSNYRRRRRSKNLRYRAPRFNNRRRPDGWLAPSLKHRVDTAANWAMRLKRLCPVTRIDMELVRFDLQKEQNPELAGVEYQHGKLFGYEVREYLLEKWQRTCAYCGKKDVPLEIEHILARSRGGTNRVSNLTLACRPCNQKKGASLVKEFLAKKPEVLARVLRQAKAPLKDAAAVNSTRWSLLRELKRLELSVHTASGGRTKFNRTRLGIPKNHALDALCVGNVAMVHDFTIPILHIKATGRGSYQRTRVTKYGFPRGYLMRAKSAFGFQTGDIVKAVIAKGKNAGAHVGRVAIRASGSFNIATANGLIAGISHKHCRRLQRADGYCYAAPPWPEGRGLRGEHTTTDVR